MVVGNLPRGPARWKQQIFSMSKCWGQHSCSSSTFSLIKLKGIIYFAMWVIKIIMKNNANKVFVKLKYKLFITNARRVITAICGNKIRNNRCGWYCTLPSGRIGKVVATHRLMYSAQQRLNRVILCTRRLRVCRPWRWGVLASQLDLSSLTPLSVPGCGRLRLGVAD